MIGSGLRVAVTEPATFNIRLVAGTAVESVTVQGGSATMQTETSALGQAIDEKVMEALPLVTRNYTDLLGLSPGVNVSVPDATQLGRGTWQQTTLLRSCVVDEGEALRNRLTGPNLGVTKGRP